MRVFVFQLIKKNFLKIGALLRLMAQVNKLCFRILISTWLYYPLFSVAVLPSKVFSEGELYYTFFLPDERDDGDSHSCLNQ